MQGFGVKPRKAERGFILLLLGGRPPYTKPMPSSRAFVPRLVAIILILLVISAFWLYAFPAASLIYVAIVVLHVGLGVVAALALVPRLIAALRNGSFMARAGWLLMAVAA